VPLNAALIPAKEGTSGRGVSYTLTVEASQLRGSQAVIVELLRTNGSKQRSNPVPF
jgi:hypothetical protein